MGTKIKIILPPQMIPKSGWQKKDLSLAPLYGAGVLASYLRKKGIEVELQDLDKSNHLFFNLYLKHRKKIPSFLVDYLMDNIPSFIVNSVSESIVKNVYVDDIDVLGISISGNWKILPALLIAKRIKEKRNIPIVLGGSFITEFEKCRKDLLRLYPFIDYLILGPGEVPLFKLIQALRGYLNIEEVDNLVYRRGNKVIKNSLTKYDIEQMPLPDFSGLNFNRYIFKTPWGKEIILPYLLTRGCVYNCRFCRTNFLEPNLQVKSFKKIKKELPKMIDMYHSNTFIFCENLLNVSYEYLDRLCTIIKAQLRINWISSMSVAGLDKKILEKMKEAGCRSVVWGIESGSDNVLRLMGKPFSVEQAEDILKTAHNLGIRNIVNIMVGYIYESKQDLQQTLDFVERNYANIDNLLIYNFNLFAGTPLFLNPQQYGIMNVSPIISNKKSYLVSNVSYKYNEIYGLEWVDKIRRNKMFYKIMQKERNRLFLRKKILGILKLFRPN